MNCATLECVSFALNSTLTTIGEGAFLGSELVNFVAPESLKELRPIVFLNCKSLESATLNKGLSMIGESCFECSGIRTLTVRCDELDIDPTAF